MSAAALGAAPVARKPNNSTIARAISAVVLRTGRRVVYRLRPQIAIAAGGADGTLLTLAFGKYKFVLRKNGNSRKGGRCGWGRG